MRKILMAAAFAAGLCAIAPVPQAQAAGAYPYCAQQGGRNGYENCGYETFGQCMASVSGVGGFCIENPRYFANRSYDERPRDRRRAN